MKIKIKKLHEDAVIPMHMREHDAGMDLTAISRSEDDYGNVVYGTGLAVEIPKGYVGLLFPRSSICKKDIVLSNSVGVIDSNYRGEIMLKFKMSINVNEFKKKHTFIEYYGIGERVGQLIIMPYPQIEFEEVEDLSDTERGDKGFGSSGN